MKIRWATEVTGVDLKEIINETVFAVNAFFGSQAPEDQLESYLEGLMERATIDCRLDIEVRQGTGTVTAVEYAADVSIDIEVPTFVDRQRYTIEGDAPTPPPVR